MSETNRHNYRFDDYELDLAKRRLLRSGGVVPLKPKAFDLLAVLVENNGKLLSKDDIFRLVWGDLFVEETNLSVSISAIRKALGETASEPRYITNVSGRGYYFEGDVEPKNGLVAESHSISRITVEHEADYASVPVLKGRSRSGFAAGAVITIVLVAVAAAVYGIFFRNSVNAAGPFQALSVTKVTTTGRAGRAAISPDGRMIAFVQTEPDGRRSLNLSQVDGTAQIQLRPAMDDLITGVAFDPDGRRIYYILFAANTTGPGILYRMPVFGGVPEKVKEQMPSRVAISPDGREIAFVITEASSKDTILKISQIDAPVERELVRLKAGQQRAFASAPSWSPDGNLLAVAVTLSEERPATTELFTVNIADGSMRQLTDQGWESILSAVWTQNSAAIVFAAGAALRMPDADRQIWQVSVSGGKPERLLSDTSSYLLMDISADGSTIAAIQGQVLSNVWVAPADDLAAARQITYDMIGKNSGGNSIDWTIDGHIFYSGLANKVASIWEMNADGSGQREAIAGGKRASYVSLPDDGKYIVFSSTRSGAPEIWRSDRNGSNLLQLTTGGNNEEPHISPDGSFVVYSSGNGETYLWSMPINGGTPTQLTRSVAGWARISPDSRFIACKYKVGDIFKLAILAAEGGEPIRTFDVPETSNFRLSVRWTPDGKSVTYRDWQNGIWKQDISGGEPARLAGLPEEKLFAYAWSRDGKWFAFSRGVEMSDVVVLRDLK